MSNEKQIAILYFDDTQVIGRIMRVNCGQSVSPIVSVRKEYTGIFESHFNDVADFKSTVNAVLEEMSKGVNHVPATLYIGVPNQFCQAQTQSSAIAFDHMTKINRFHIQTLWNDIEFDETSVEIIHQQALYYKLEGYNEVLIDVLGATTTGVEMEASAITVNRDFVSYFDLGAMQKAGFSTYQFVSIAASELFMIPEKIRDSGCTLVRCDFFSTSVANVLGDGLTQMSHFNLGSGYLIGETVEYFNVDFDTATKLVAQCTPTYEVLLEEKYAANTSHVPAGIFNKFVTGHLNDFSSQINNMDTARVIYMTGGNFDQIYGATNIIANACDRTVVRCKDVLTGEAVYPKNTINALARYIINNY